MARYDSHIRRGHPVIFALLIIVAIIVLGLTASLESDYDSSRIDFLLFCSVWTIVFSPVLIGFFFAAPGHIVASVGVHWVFMFITWIFWLSGAAALSDKLDGPFTSRNCDRFGLPDCGTLRATEAFAWIEWILLTLAFIVVTFLTVHHVRGGRGYRQPMYETV